VKAEVVARTSRLRPRTIKAKAKEYNSLVASGLRQIFYYGWG